MLPVAYVAAVKAVQAVLVAAEASLISDGRWGTTTDRIYREASPAVRAAADAVARVFGTSVEALRVKRAELVKAGGGAWIAETEVDALVTRAARDLGIAEHTEALKAFVRLEARKKKVGDEVFFDARSVNGSSRGLMQMQPAAWVDAAKVTELPPYAEVWDPRSNVRAGVAYAKFNLANAERFGLTFPVNGETLYLMHNQGLGFFSRGAVTAREKQSRTVQALIDKWYRRGGWR